MVTDGVGTMRSLDGLKRYEVVLASNSPRRRELLGMLGVNFRVSVPTDVEECYPESMAADEVPEYLARKKAEAYVAQLWRDGQLVISADTVVILAEQVLGKPVDAADARRMLRELSGRKHRVVSGVAVTDGRRMESFRAVTEVEFAALSDVEIDDYVSCYRPLDKAGAYGIQEWIGCMGISRIEGSFYNVMGLPLHRLYTLLRSF